MAQAFMSNTIAREEVLRDWGEEIQLWEVVCKSRSKDRYDCHEDLSPALFIDKEFLQFANPLLPAEIMRKTFLQKKFPS